MTALRALSVSAVVLLLAGCHEPWIDLGGYGGDSCAESYYPRDAWECDAPGGCCFGDGGSPSYDAGDAVANGGGGADAGKPKKPAVDAGRD